MGFPTRLDRWLWFGTAALAFVAAGFGVHNPSTYEGLVPDTIMPGVYSQDLVTLLLSSILAVLAFSGRSYPSQKRVVAHGILGFLFYAYGIYAMERMYNALYPLYLTIFGISLFVLIYSVTTGLDETTTRLRVPAILRILSAGYGMLIAVMFTLLWLSELVPLMKAGRRIDHLYSIYIIDLSFVMPAFVIAALLALRRHPIGLMGLPALFVVGAGILSPLALAEWIKPFRYGLTRDVGGMLLFGILTLVFMVLAGAFLATMRMEPANAADSPASSSHRS